MDNHDETHCFGAKFPQYQSRWSKALYLFSYLNIWNNPTYKYALVSLPC